MSNRGDRRRNPFQNGSTRHLHGVFLRNDLPESLSGTIFGDLSPADTTTRGIVAMKGLRGCRNVAFSG